MELFGIRDLRERMGDLSRTAEAGKLAVITRHDRPLMAGIPFNESLFQEGVHICLAVHLFSQGVITPAKAARMAGLPLESFFRKLGHLGVPVVDYDLDELEQELKNLGG
nr:UPF0175 family protein [Endozoicomonas sp.]